MEALITSPLEEQEKQALYARTSFGDANYILGEYVEAFLRKNRIESYLLPKMLRRRIIVTVLFSLVLFLDIVEACFLHRHYVWNVLIPVAAAAASLLTLRNQNMKGYLVKEIKTRPDDEMDNILSSQVSGARPGLLCSLLCAVLVAATLVGSALLFYHPRLFFERNNTGGYSLRYCTLSLSGQDSISVPDTYNGLPVTEIRGSVFKNLNVRQVHLPANLREVRGNTFENCSRLRSISIPDGVTRIGGHAFYGCSSLSRVFVPASVKEIGSSAFRRCVSLYSIRIPNGCLVNSRAFKESPTRIERY